MKKHYFVEFKVGSAWVETKPFDGCVDSEAAAAATEKTLHDAGIKTRIVVIKSERTVLGA